jgi:hypothetical protein
MSGKEEEEKENYKIEEYTTVRHGGTLKREEYQQH